MNPLPKYSIDLVEKVEKTLLEDEKISLIFLLFGDDKAALKIAKECSSPLIDWVSQQSGGIEDKKCINTFLEALAIVGNFELLSKLFCINKKEANERFLPNSNHSSLYVPLLRKCLYHMCEEMNEEDCLIFLDAMHQSPPVLDEEKYNPLNLEIYFLHWLADGVISASNIEPILNALQKIGKNEICDSLDHFRTKKIQNTPYNDPNRPLLGKPKLFFIQACQGSDYQEVVRRNTAVPEDTCVIVTDGPSSPPAANLDSAGLHEDFFTFLSTV
ncbi:hypothetical protein B566_EDAN018572, partial [Ephemera danica]